MLANVSLRRSRLAASIAVQATAAQASPLDISDLTAFPVREPVSRRAYTIVRVRTRAGVTGYGECPGASAAQVAEASRAIAGLPGTAFEVVSRRLPENGVLNGAINMALLDVAGKAAKAPIYQVLGGPTRFKARALAPLAGDTDAGLAAFMKQATAAGFRAFLVPVPVTASRNAGQAWVLAVRKRMEALREAGGENMDFVLDGGGSLTPGDAASVATALEKFHLLWFDEPCPLVNVGAARKISVENVTPVGFGRHIRKGPGFQDLLREDAIDVIRPDISLSGISLIRRMVAIAETYYVAAAPFHNGGPVATAAALHLAASLPNFFIQQIPLPAAEEDRRMRAEICGAGVEAVKDGFASLPTGPGLGITVNEEALKKYREVAA